MPSVKSVYTDGACSGNPGPGGWGVVVYLDDGTCHELGGPAVDTTNNRMELQAAIESLTYLHTLPPQESIPLYTDSEYVKKGVTQWVAGWKRKGWKTAKGTPVLNQDLWQTLDQLNESWIEWRYVRGHSGDVGNERCDEIARAFSLGQTPALSTNKATRLESLESSTLSHPSRVPSEAVSPPKVMAQSLDTVLQRLRFADEIATQGYLLTDEELASLINCTLEEIHQHTEPWQWRNWKILPITKGELNFWQLLREKSI